MPTNQTESLTRQSQAADAQHLLENLPVHTADQQLKDLLAQESVGPNPGESPFVESVLTGLSWFVCAAVIVAVALLTWDSAKGVMGQ